VERLPNDSLLAAAAPPHYQTRLPSADCLSYAV